MSNTFFKGGAKIFLEEIKFPAPLVYIALCPPALPTFRRPCEQLSKHMARVPMQPHRLHRLKAGPGLRSLFLEIIFVRELVCFFFDIFFTHDY